MQQDSSSPQRLTSRLDGLPFSRWHLLMVLALGMIWIFDGYEVSLISLFRNYIEHESSAEDFKIIATSYQVGCIIGSVGFGICAYLYGRRCVFLITLAIYALGIGCSMVEGQMWLFVLGRLLTGCSVGGEFTAIFSAVDEFLPPQVRGRVDIAIDGTWHFGGALAAIINIIVGDTEYWRSLFAVGFIGVLALAYFRSSLPESPRWLILNNNHDKALTIIRQIQYCVENKTCSLPSASELPLEEPNPMENINLSSPHSETPAQPLPAPAISSILPLLKHLSASYKGRLLLSIFLIFTQAFYFNSVYYTFPATLQQKFHFDQREISVYMLPLSIISFVSTLLVGPFFDIFGRKRMLLITYCGGGILLGFSMLTQTSIQLEIVTVAMFMFSSPASSAANLIASEIFPTSGRSIILSFIFVFGMVGGILGVWQTSPYISIILMILAGFVGFFFCPNAENKSLEQVNAF